MLKNKLFVAVAALALLALGSCSTANVGTSAPVLPDHATSAFQVQVLDGTYDFGASAKGVYATLDPSPQLDKDHVVLNLHVDGAQGLKNFFVRVKYDPTQYRAMVVQPTKLMGDASSLLSLYVPDGKGNLDYGQTLVNEDYQVGFTGSGIMAQVSFTKQPELIARHVSAVADKPLSAVNNLVFDGANTLTWSFANQGDYDQNGSVGIADITGLGKHFNHSTNGAGPFPWTSSDSASDGNNDGACTINDLTPLGANLNKSILGGYHVYHSASAADYPATALGANGAGAADLGVVAFSTAAGDRNVVRVTFTSNVAAPVANDFYWVRPDDGAGAIGIASNLVGGNPAALPALSLNTGVSPAQSGSGTQADPWIMLDTNNYTYTLLDTPGGTDKSTDPGTTFVVTPSTAGTFTANVLDIATGFTGDFTVTASFNGVFNHPSSNQYSHVGGVLPGNQPNIIKDPTDGNWTNVTGTGADDTNAYVLHTSTFNPDADSNGSYDLTFKLAATSGVGGAAIPNANLDWSAFPPFVPFDAAAFTADATAGTFQAWQFSDGYLFAQDPAQPGAPGKSNSLYVSVQSLQP